MTTPVPGRSSSCWHFPKMTKPWKLVFVLLGIFLAGSISGAFLAKQFAREWMAKRLGPEQWAPNHVKRLTEKLDLPAEQAELIRPVVRRNMTEMNRLREKQLAETAVIVDRMQHEISELLTPEQRTKYEELVKESREKFKKQSQERGARPPGTGGQKSGNGPGPEPKGP